MRWLRKLRSLFRKESLETEMADEMQAHLEFQIERNLKAGMKPDEARYAALRQFGNVASVQEQAREARGFVWLEQFGKDLRYAARSLRRSPSFTVTAVLTLALGIGINAALFTVFNTIALRSLPVKDPEMLVKVAGQGAQRGGLYPNWSYADYVDLRDGNQSLSDLAAVWPPLSPSTMAAPWRRIRCLTCAARASCSSRTSRRIISEPSGPSLRSGAPSCRRKTRPR